MAAKPKLSPAQWTEVRERWEGDPRKGFPWIIEEMGLPVSAEALRLRSKSEGWAKGGSKVAEAKHGKPREPSKHPSKSKLGKTHESKLGISHDEAVESEQEEARSVGRPTLYRDEYVEQVRRLALLGLTATLLITFLTSFFLARRQQAIDDGSMPLAERIEEYINFRTVSIFFAGVFIVNLFASPIWTTKDHPELLITAAHYQPAMMPLIAASIGVFVAMGMLLPTTRSNKVLRTIVMVLSYSLVLYCNFAIFYGGDDSASAATIPTLLVTILPVGVIIWYIVDCFRSIKQ
jgi:hypothetical protein